ncbi:MAG: deoxyribonuclease IV, partial [Clostridia bacterium]|nr:deoxyribonuclease IV [Clostridia bacterium]
MRIGAHLTIAKGLPAAAELAVAVGANTFGFFTRNPRGGAVRAMPGAEIQQWQALRRERDLFPIVGHLPYTVNLASAKPETRSFARRVIREDLERAAVYGAEFLVLHPGSHQGDGVDAGIGRIVEGLAAILDGFQGPTRLLLETMSGQGTEIGGDLAHLARIFAELGRPSLLGVCIDSCHLFAAGYDLRTRDGIDAALAALDAAVGLDRVLAAHLNDSQGGLGSRRDRHARLGDGHLGWEGLRALVRHPFVGGLPLVIACLLYTNDSADE